VAGAPGKCQKTAGGVGAECNYSIYPPKECQEGLVCKTPPGIYGAPGKCARE
jgi:hypothetical protein